MTDTANQPKRRGRKIIFAFVLVLASLVSWWYWPRGDARFVGKWHLVAADGKSRHVVIVMDRQGNYTELPNSTDYPVASTTYEVVGEEFVISGSGNIVREIWETGLWTSVKQLAARESNFLGESRYQVSYPSPNVILLHRHDAPEVVLQLRRIPE